MAILKFTQTLSTDQSFLLTVRKHISLLSNEELLYFSFRFITNISKLMTTVTTQAEILSQYDVLFALNRERVISHPACKFKTYYIIIYN